MGTAGWHRDSGGTHGHGVWWRWQTDDARPYTTPLGCNCLVYLQDMTDDSGQLRVVPFSHLGGIPTPEPEAKMASSGKKEGTGKSQRQVQGST